MKIRVSDAAIRELAHTATIRKADIFSENSHTRARHKTDKATPIIAQRLLTEKKMKLNENKGSLMYVYARK